MARTTIAVETATRDELEKVRQQMGSASMDDALRSLMWEHACNEGLTRLDEDPALRAGYADEALQLAEVDVEVTG